MAKKSNSSDRHKPRRMVNVRGPLAAVLDELAEELATDVTELVNQAVREFLERHERWPRKPRPGPAKE